MESVNDNKNIAHKGKQKTFYVYTKPNTNHECVGIFSHDTEANKMLIISISTDTLSKNLRLI